MLAFTTTRRAVCPLYRGPLDSTRPAPAPRPQAQGSTRSHGTAMERPGPPRVIWARVFNAAAVESGLALYASLMTVMPSPGSSTSMRQRSARGTVSIAATMASVTAFARSDDRRAELRETERMLATLIGNLPGMVYRCRNDERWTLELVSEGCVELTGYSPQELLFNSRVSYEQVIHASDRGWVRAQVQSALAAHRRFAIEYRIVCRDGCPVSRGCTSGSRRGSGPGPRA
mgnify:CR=1 FL=1